MYTRKVCTWIGPFGRRIKKKRDMAYFFFIPPRILGWRALLRGAKKMPTPNRKNFVINKTRAEYRVNMHLSNPEEIEFCLRLADTNVDTILTQAEHLTNLFNDPTYRFRDEI
jgi:hypothetical protein